MKQRQLPPIAKTKRMAALEQEHGKDIREIIADLAAKSETQAQLAERLKVSPQICAQWIKKCKAAGSTLTLKFTP